MPEPFGGSGLGISEAAVLMREIAESGAGLAGASSVHMNIFGLQPVVVFGTDEQKARMLPPLIAGDEKACFAVTEPDAGLNTTEIKTRADRDGDVYRVTGQKIWISTAKVADKAMILARTTPLDQVNKKTEGLSLFYTPLDRSKVEVRTIRRWAAMRWTPTCCSSTAWRFRSKTASARRGRGSRCCCTASTPSACWWAPRQWA